MQDYKPNSHRFKEEQSRATAASNNTEQKRAKKVVKGSVKVKKKGVIESCVDKFVSEDVPNIQKYLVSEVIIPTLKNTIWDAFTNTLDIVLFGGTGRGRKNTPGSSRAPYVSYDKCSNNNRGRTSEEPRRSKYDFSSITFYNKQDAEEVLRQMDAIMDEYKLVTVSDLYDLIGETGEYTDSKYGWQNIRNAQVVRGRDGYYIQLPKPLPID